MSLLLLSHSLCAKKILSSSTSKLLLFSALPKYFAPAVTMSFSFQHHVLLFLFLSLLTWVSAVPTPVELSPRACSTVGPSNISRLTKSTPNDYLNGLLFALHRNGGANSNTIKSVVSFSYIPAGATGCMLEIDIPKLPTQNTPGPIASGTGTQSDVWLLTNPPRDNPYDNGFIYQYSWNNPPVKSQFVSTTIFPVGTPTDGPYKTYMWSGTCKQTLSFQFELSDWQQGSGDVNFYTSMGGKSGLTPIGFKMVYNC
jgi:hypothetical protein